MGAFNTHENFLHVFVFQDDPFAIFFLPKRLPIIISLKPMVAKTESIFEACNFQTAHQKGQNKWSNLSLIDGRKKKNSRHFIQFLEMYPQRELLQMNSRTFLPAGKLVMNYL